MEAAVKWLQFADVETKISGMKPALCLRGRKFASCIIDDETTLRVEKVDLREYDTMKVLIHKGQPYDPKKCARNFLDRYTRADIKRTATQGALELLDRVLKGEVPDEVIEAAAVEAPEPPKSNGHATHSTILSSICAELKIDPTVARRKLRKAGLHAPYDNESTIRGALK